MKKLSILAVSFLICASTLVFSQTNDEGLAFLQFGFLNPGARALGMGGAFIGLADDATAAQSNPAGLSILIRPELSVEFASTQFRNRIPWAEGNYFLSQNTIDDPFRHFRQYDFEFLYESRDFPKRINNVSFVSFVYPVLKNRFVLAGSYTEQTKFEREFETEPFPGRCRNCFNPFLGFAPTVSQLNLSLNNVGMSAAASFGSYLRLGMTLNRSKLSLDSLTVRLNRGAINNIEELNAEDSKFSVTIGTLIEPIEQLSVGVVYSKRPKFDATSSFLQLTSTEVFPQKFKTPDSAGLGLSFKPSNRFRINFDVVRIWYSQLMDGYYNAFFVDFALVDNDAEKTFQRTTLEVPDGTEIRVGGEYVFFVRNNPVALRLGYWKEPFHSVIQTENDRDLVNIIRLDDGPEVEDVGIDPFHSRSFLKDNHHASIGGGIVFKQASLDWAFDYSDNFQRFLLSTVLYFQFTD